jgi:hypothetical protein
LPAPPTGGPWSRWGARLPLMREAGRAWVMAATRRGPSPYVHADCSLAAAGGLTPSPARRTIVRPRHRRMRCPKRHASEPRGASLWRSAKCLPSGAWRVGHVARPRCAARATPFGPEVGTSCAGLSRPGSLSRGSAGSSGRSRT